MNDIDELRKYYAGLNFSQKKEFILNLKKKLDGMNSPKHLRFFEECVRSYNEEVRTKNKAAGYSENAPKTKIPDISPDTFAKALATLIYGGGPKSGASASAIKARLIGKWQREPDEGDFYYEFKEDGTFETNEFEDSSASTSSDKLLGNFSVSIDNVVLMEPHEKLRFNSLMFSQSGDSLIIRLKDGLTFEYKKI
jgi:hypothetical protein